MQITVKQFNLIENALMQNLEVFGEINKKHKPHLKDEFFKDWEELRKLHSLFCKAIGEIEGSLEDMENYPQHNQALNYIITVQKEN